MVSSKELIRKSRHIILYGAILAILAFALKWMQWKFLIRDYSVEIYIGVIAVLFTALGIWIANQLARSKTRTVVVEKEIYLPPQDDAAINTTELEKLKLTNREYEVLQLLSKGYSNAEIAENLFLSVSTIKTHVSNLLMKLDVKSRAQAIEKSRRLRITP